MFCLAALLAYGCGARPASTQPAGSEASSSHLVISDVTLISPERGAPLEHANVRIRAGRVEAVSERPLSGGQRINGIGRYLIPGLIDTHVHLAIAPGFPAAMTAEDAAANPDIATGALAQDPRSFLYSGFTTLLDLVGSGDRIARWNALDVRPDAYFCGAAVIVNHQVRAVRFPAFSYAESKLAFDAALSATARETPEAVVGRIADDGAICLKTMYDSFARIVPGADELRALVAAAHARDLPVFIHANRRDGQAVAVAANVDVVAHGLWRNQDEPPELDEAARDILAGVVRNRMGYQPTSQVIVGELKTLDDEFLKQAALTDVYPAKLIEWFSSAQYKNPVRARLSYPGGEARVQGTIRRAAEVTRFLAERDARLLFGSDTPSAELHTNPPGLNGRMEMNNWIAAGVPEAKLFRALTIDNARVMRLDDEIGTIEAGKKANLLLLRANPLENVDAYDAIETVFLHGRPIARETLSARHAIGAK
jgi:imidazolonepropionase-like amidohydrolase